MITQTDGTKMQPYPLLLLWRIVRKRREKRLALIAERHGLALGRLTGKRRAA